MEELNYLCYMTTLLHDIHTTLTRLTLGVLSLKQGVESFYEYMWVLAKHEVNPLTVLPLAFYQFPLLTNVANGSI